MVNGILNPWYMTCISKVSYGTLKNELGIRNFIALQANIYSHIAKLGLIKKMVAYTKRKNSIGLNSTLPSFLHIEMIKRVFE